MSDFLFREDLASLDPFVHELIGREAERQARKLILTSSESYAPRAVRQAQDAVFQNLYAEGYPPLHMTRDAEALLEDSARPQTGQRRYADRRFYKGADYTYFIEGLVQRRAAALLATAKTPADHILVNAQAPSGVAANLAVYEAIMQPGDMLMGMHPFQGGHLMRGSDLNFSGRRYQVTHYGVDAKTDRLNYDALLALARQHHPRVIVAGYTSYSWAPDWAALRAIADEVGAILLADISHVAGLALAGVYPNPVDYAHVTTFTTHKTLGGPRGALILTSNEELAGKIDRVVSAAAQGSPHVNKFTAIAVALELARSQPFRHLQRQSMANTAALADGLVKRGLRLAYGGSDTHLLLLDLKSAPATTAYPLYGEPAARILDMAGIVVNKNTIPGDTSTALATGICMSTSWVTQHGLTEVDMDTLAGLIQRVVTATKPFTYTGLVGLQPRGKLELAVLEEVKRGVEALADKANIGSQVVSQSDRPPIPTQQAKSHLALRLSSWHASAFVQQVVTANIAGLQPGQAQRAFILDQHGQLIDDIVVLREQPDAWGRERYLLILHAAQAEQVKAWLRGLADGYTLFDDDILRKVEGPVAIEDAPEGDIAGALALAGASPQVKTTAAADLFRAYPALFDLSKLYFVGRASLDPVTPKSNKIEWSWPAASGPEKRTELYEEHRKLGAKLVPFAGWEMPVWYSSVMEEHKAVREAAGLFDVSHMGVFEVMGEHAASFLEVVSSNHVHWLEDGQSCYSYLPNPDGKIIDDFMIYRLKADHFLLVVNASNEAKDWDWLNAVNEGRVLIDRQRPWLQVEAKATLRNLKEPTTGARQKRDIALQGPNSVKILQALTDDPATQTALARVRRTDLVEIELSGIPLVAARTGYTGEDIGFEIFVHPDQVVRLWNLILEKGAAYGLKPCGLASRDSTRTEAGLPLYGHELDGPFDISPMGGGFPSYVKFHKPFFVGREALLASEAGRSMQIVRFRMESKGVRRPSTGDPVVDRQGRFIGHVTSCAVDSEGYLLGLAYLKSQAAAPGTPISIFVLPPKPQPEKGKAELAEGDRVLMPVEASIISRFPPKGKRPAST